MTLLPATSQRYDSESRVTALSVFIVDGFFHDCYRLVMNAVSGAGLAHVHRRFKRVLSRLRAAATRQLQVTLTKSAIGSYTPVMAEPCLDEVERTLVERFSDLYYSKLDGGRGLHTIVLSWMGYELLKCPLDLWIYQELIVRERPDLIIEVGTYKGGSALYLAHICDAVGTGSVVTIDIDAGYAAIRPQHERIRYVVGSSLDEEVFSSVSAMAKEKSNVMVILDGDHHCDHVLKELELYESLVRPGGYMIVEDTNINGHPTYPEFGPGPWEAVSVFLEGNAAFKADRSCERFLLTMNPRGYLRRVA